jgi:hypothetical protein
MRAGVFSARNSRRFAGSNPKLSRLSRRVPFLEGFLPFKGKAATPLESLGNYTEACLEPSRSRDTSKSRPEKGTASHDQIV